MQVVDAGGIAAWRDGLLQYQDEPLPSVIADVTRYSKYDIVIADPAVAELRVTGTVFANDVESWLQSLEAALPVRAIRAPTEPCAWNHIAQVLTADSLARITNKEESTMCRNATSIVMGATSTKWET